MQRPISKFYVTFIAVLQNYVSNIVNRGSLNLLYLCICPFSPHEVSCVYPLRYLFIYLFIMKSYMSTQ